MKVKKQLDMKKFRKAIRDAKKLNYIELSQNRKLHLHGALRYRGPKVDESIAANSGRAFRSIVREITGEGVKIDEALSIFGEEAFNKLSKLNPKMESTKRQEAINRLLAKCCVPTLNERELVLYDLMTFNDELFNKEG